MKPKYCYSTITHHKYYYGHGEESVDIYVNLNREHRQRSGCINFFLDPTIPFNSLFIWASWSYWTFQKPKKKFPEAK
jgi:hypothetical protein